MGFLEGLIYMLWRGIAIGVIISAPMGPVGILCVQRTLEKGRRSGFFTGVGAAVSDLLYCLLTGFGLSFIEDFLKANQNVIQIVGSVVLVVFGVYLFKSNPARTLKKPETERPSAGKNVLSGFLFTFSNPLIIFLIIGLFARFNFLLPEISLPHYIMGFVAIFAGAILWWWLVSFFIDKVRSHFNLRSMWLVNKITGGIIMVFAVVGIVTAITSMANARTREPVYLNSVRGFGRLDDRPEGADRLIIESQGPDTTVRFLPLDRAEEFSFSFRCSNIHNESGRRYPFTDADGKTRKRSGCPWGLLLRGESAQACLTVETEDNRSDELMPQLLTAELTAGDSVAGIGSINSGVDFHDGENAYRLRKEGGRISFSAGNRGYRNLFDVAASDGPCDSIGIWVAPGGKIELDHIVLEVTAEPLPRGRVEVSHFADPDVRHSYFSRSTDAVEGVWAVFDRSLEDNLLRMGGDYRLALVKNSRGYDIFYIDGARKSASRWLPGMTKGRLTATDFRNVFDVEWLDPSAAPLGGGIKAQFMAPDILVLQFPDHGASTLRLRKIKEKYGER